MLPLTPHSATRPVRGRSAGFSLIEIMVGMVIALLATIVMMNVFSMFEAQKRTTTGGSDLQNNGAIALLSLKNEIEKAGYGVSDVDIMGCSLQLSPSITIPAIAPVIINPQTSTSTASNTPLIPGADQNTDTLLVFYSNTNNMSEADALMSGAQSGVAMTTQLTPNSPLTYVVNDEVMTWPYGKIPPTCNLKVDTVTSITPTSQPQFLHLNQGIASSDLTSVDAIWKYGKIFNLGQSYTLEAFAIRNGNLTVCTFSATNDCTDPSKTNDSTVWLPIGNDIVSMRAQYGRDDASGDPVTTPQHMSGMVNTYDQTTPLSGSATYSCDWFRVRAVRIVLVGRNNQPNPLTVTTNDPKWAGTSTVINKNNQMCPRTSGADIDLSCTNTNLPPGFTWQNYRYKTFETTISIRNVAMQGINVNC